MPNTSIIDKIRPVLLDFLDIHAEEVMPAAMLIEDLGADSLDMIEIMMSVEEEFRIHILDEEAEKIVTVGDLVNLIELKGGAA